MAFVQDIYPLFLAKNEFSFEVATFGGSLFPGGRGGGRYFWDLLTPVTFCCYFRGVITFGTLQYYAPCIQGVCCSSDAGI